MNEQVNKGGCYTLRWQVVYIRGANTVKYNGILEVVLPYNSQHGEKQEKGGGGGGSSSGSGGRRAVERLGQGSEEDGRCAPAS